MNYVRRVRKITLENCNDEIERRKEIYCARGGRGAGLKPLFVWRIKHAFETYNDIFSVWRMQGVLQDAGGGVGHDKQPNFRRVLFKVSAHFSVENAIN